MSLHDLRVKQHRPYGGSAILSRFYNGMLTDEMFQRACRAFSMQVYHDLLHTSGGSLIIDKSPRYYYILEFLDKLFPHSRRIMLMRNPLDIASSYKKVHASSKDRFDILEHLYGAEFDVKMADLTVGLFRYAEYCAEDNPYTYRLSYEQLASNPRDELIELSKFLHIDYEEGMEHYGQYRNSAKSDLFFSMGVGDPLLAKHTSPHQDSINSWHEVLSRQEVDLLCRALGAEIFHRLGYSEQLARAEHLTGVRYEPGPDQELLALRQKQIQDLTGYRWEIGYRMSIAEEDQVEGWVDQVVAVSEQADTHPTSVSEQELMQMRITLRAAEQRLEHVYEERDRYMRRYTQLKQKIDRLKSKIPFGNRLSRWASSLTREGG